LDRTLAIDPTGELLVVRALLARWTLVGRTGSILWVVNATQDA